MSSYCCEGRLPFRWCPAEGALYLPWTQLTDLRDCGHRWKNKLYFHQFTSNARI